MYGSSRRKVFYLAAVLLLLMPVAANAAGGFSDVEDDSVFLDDIEWLADAGVTLGCNPPTNDLFCPKSVVTREQMAAFMHRLATNRVVDAGTVDGVDSAELMQKSDYDADGDQVVDSTEVKIRYSDAEFAVDMDVSETERLVCLTSPVTFESETTVVTAGGVSLDPEGFSVSDVYGYVYYSDDDGGTWTLFDNASVESNPVTGSLNSAFPMNSVNTLDAGTYVFGIGTWGEPLNPGIDYYGYCELAVTAYVGQGPNMDVEIVYTER